MEREILTEKDHKPLYGLLLAGGYSTRMGTDKAFFEYKNEPIYKRSARLLASVCVRTFISCRLEQETLFSGYPTIPDQDPSCGPASGILSAFLSYPAVSWLVIPVDMPNLTISFLQNNLIKKCDSECDVVAIREGNSGYLQPMVAIYHPSSVSVMQREFNKGNYSLKSILNQLNTQEIEYFDSNKILSNYNTRADWENEK
ncbi:MAG: molybdenum cofactor guanylyltransferase [Saprospiraceae bacterium]|nr:molybdenum cofactor guanylyltransferase [Saprospiraceae bacterium]